MAPNSPAPSSTRDGRPRRASASAVVSPPSPPPQMRMGLSLAIAALAELAYHADALDLPVERHARRLLHAFPHGLAQCLDVGCGRGAEIDQEIAVHFRHLRIADLEAAAAGGVDELPGLVPWRILEGRAAGAALDRLRRFA